MIDTCNEKCPYQLYIHDSYLKKSLLVVMVMSDQQQVFAWGNNEYGQLGVDSQEQQVKKLNHVINFVSGKNTNASQP